MKYTESIAYVRSFVEDAGIAIYDTIPKQKADKSKERSSIREKLSAAKKVQQPRSIAQTKSKRKDMEL